MLQNNEILKKWFDYRLQKWFDYSLLKLFDFSLLKWFDSPIKMSKNDNFREKCLGNNSQKCRKMTNSRLI